MTCPQWRQVDAALFAAVVGGRDDARYHLIVERLPSGNGWDWTAWRPGDAPRDARHGVAPSAAEAMRAAEAAVDLWEAGTAPGA